MCLFQISDDYDGYIPHPLAEPVPRYHPGYHFDAQRPVRIPSRAYVEPDQPHIPYTPPTQLFYSYGRPRRIGSIQAFRRRPQSVPQPSTATSGTMQSPAQPVETSLLSDRYDVTTHVSDAEIKKTVKASPSPTTAPPHDKGTKEVISPTRPESKQPLAPPLTPPLSSPILVSKGTQTPETLSAPSKHKTKSIQRSALRSSSSTSPTTLPDLSDLSDEELQEATLANTIANRSVRAPERHKRKPKGTRRVHFANPSPNSGATSDPISYLGLHDSDTDSGMDDDLDAWGAPKALGRVLSPPRGRPRARGPELRRYAAPYVEDVEDEE